MLLRCRQGMTEVMGRPNPVNVLFLGGSNTLLSRGYVDSVRQIAAQVYGQELRIENRAVGGNSSIHGIEILAGVPALTDFDVIFIEYAVNDIFSNHTMQAWDAGYEGLLRAILQAHPSARIVNLLLSPRKPRSEERKEAIFSRTWELSRHYGVECVDVDAYLRVELQLSSEEFAALYSDNAHYKRPIVSALIGNFICNHVFGRAAVPALFPVPAVHEVNFQDAAVVDFTAIDQYGTVRRDFRNSKFSCVSREVQPGFEYEVELPGSVISLSFIAAPESGTLMVAEENEPPFLMETLHTEVKSERFAFLIRCFLLGWKDWSKPKHTRPRRVRFSLAASSQAQSVRMRNSPGMVPSEKTEIAQRAFLLSALCHRA
jgi:hypothetical protein